ncbi:MAG: DUF2974 domain-containing protein [Firmicutes bacterium]|nr:DUF2974 domain-containing protein [Bacillota bacterium]
MSDIIDYIKWRGDISFFNDKFNEIDALILSQFSYLDFSDIVSDDFDDDISLKEAWRLFSKISRHCDRKDPGVLISKDVTLLFEEMAKSERFLCMRLCGYVNTVDEKEEKQFSAITAILPDGTNVVVFRGTDDTIVGWKEDFNMSFLDNVPSQLSAIDYLTKASSKLEGGMIIAGHSKGGNLAIYSSLFCDSGVRKRIIGIYNNDGPGFKPELLTKRSYKEIYDRIHSYIPQSSVVGMLFACHDEYKIVKSRQFGLLQHNPFNWEVVGNKFVLCDKISEGSAFADSTFRDWVMKMDKNQKEKFVDALFEIIEASNATTLTELKEDGMKGYGAMIKSLTLADDETKSVLIKTLQLLFETAKDNLLYGKSKKEMAMEKVEDIVSKVKLHKSKKYVVVKKKEGEL